MCVSIDMYVLYLYCVCVPCTRTNNVCVRKSLRKCVIRYHTSGSFADQLLLQHLHLLLGMECNAKVLYVWMVTFRNRDS